MSYIITDIDGTLTTTGDTPNQPYIDWLNEQVMSGEEQVIVVSARSIDRLQETRAWLQENKVAGVEAVHLNDFEGTPFATGLAFKEYKYKLLIEEFGADNIEMVVDNDADVRAMARELGLEALTPDEAIASTMDTTEEQNAIRAQVDVPAYIQSAADKGLAYYAEGLGGDGLVEQAAGVVAQVQDDAVELLAVVFAQLGQGLGHFVAGLDLKLGDADVAVA